MDPIIFLLMLGASVILADPCSEFKTCGKCIGNNLSCVWCPDKGHIGPRCLTYSTVKKQWCSSIINPVTGKSNITENNNFRPKTDKQSAVQIRPQNITINARPGDKVSFEFYYKPAQDYPIDIYYLFDNSYTMAKHKAILVKHAKKIHNELKKLSNNVRFGAGSFIEKLALPFADPEKHALNTFNNHISLTDDISKFVDVVEKVKHSGNYDEPECGLDALMQVMVCQKINWRKEARRMIIFSTDATYHSAGDGKFVGAYKQNDMTCHLVEGPKNSYISHTYDMAAALTYDYPSVSQINKIASENDFSIYFTTLNNVRRDYEALVQRIQGAKYVELNKDPEATSSIGIVDLIKTEYLKLVHNVEIDTGKVPDHIDLSLNPRCKKNFDNKACEIAHASVLTIRGTIQIKSCLSENILEDIIIKPIGLRESLSIKVEPICECDCEKNGSGEKNSPICESNGTYQCGVCKCNKNRYGSNCQCNGTSTEELDLQLCKAKTNDSNVCSGNGECKCGKCECWEGYEGIYCQYRTNDCPAYEGKVCGNHGKCVKSKCQCFPGWKGSYCTCPEDTKTCVGANSKICSGNGECKCGSCECTKYDTLNNLYRGKYCNLCETCVEQRCQELGDYVECNYNGNQKKCDNEYQVKTNHAVLIKNQTEINSWLDGTRCSKFLDDRSSIVFKYVDDNNSTVIWIQKEKELPPEIPVGLTIGGTLGGILLIGILTVIIWKILVDIYDRREYRKFEEEAKAAGYNVSFNILYEPPATDFKNPTFSQEG